MLAAPWELWRTVSAGIGVALVVVLLTRHVFEARLAPRARKALDLVAIPLFLLFLLYIVTDFMRPVP